MSNYVYCERGFHPCCPDIAEAEIARLCCHVCVNLTLDAACDCRFPLTCRTDGLTL